MQADLTHFQLVNGILCVNSSPNRLFVYIDNQDQIPNLVQFKTEYPKITILSIVKFDINVTNAIITPTRKVAAKTHPGDMSLYNVLGKGFKDYEYYVTSLVFIKKQDL